MKTSRLAGSGDLPEHQGAVLGQGSKEKGGNAMLVFIEKCQ